VHNHNKTKEIKKTMFQLTNDSTGDNNDKVDPRETYEYGSSSSSVKTVISSGILLDIFNAAMQMKENNKIFSCICLIKTKKDTYEIRSFNSLPSNDNASSSRSIFGYISDLFKSRQQQPTTTNQIKNAHSTSTTTDCNLSMHTNNFMLNVMGENESMVVFISYWYGNQKYIAYFDIPKEIFKFPIYDNILNQNDVVFDNIYVISAKICIQNKKDEDDVNIILDVTDVVEEMMGPFKDFHGRWTKQNRMDEIVGNMTFSRILDVMRLKNMNFDISAIYRKGFRSFIMFTYSDSSTTIMNL
jgi:hypothetical protein